MTKTLKHLDRFLSRIEGLMIATLAIIALGSGVMQVVLRYIFNTGFHWNEPIFITFTVWAMLFGSSRAVRDHVHARVEVIADNLPHPFAHIAGILSYLASLLLTSFYFYCGMAYVQFVNSMGIGGMETGIPDALTFSIVPIAMGMMALRYIILIIELIKDPLSRHGGHTNPTAGGT